MEFLLFYVDNFKKTSETRERTVRSLTGWLSLQKDGQNLNRAAKRSTGLVPRLTGQRFSLTGWLPNLQDGFPSQQDSNKISRAGGNGLFA